MKKVAVGLSGGVDSCLAALLLKRQGYDVSGITMQVYTGGNIGGNAAGTASGCYGCDKAEDIKNIKKFCKDFGINYQVFDCSKEYKTKVLDYFKSEYLSGRTPNPCVQCNREIKFGFLPVLAKSKGVTFDFFATGHYAVVEFNKAQSAFLLKRHPDGTRDQSYFLYRLNQEILSKILFPLTSYTKNEVRAIARENNLFSADKADSQDFYNGDYADLLGARVKTGNIVNKCGKVLGKHNGFWNYTLGQRRGLGVAAPEPLYVIEINAGKNEVVVGSETETQSSGCIIDNLNWVSRAPEKNAQYSTKARSTQNPQTACIEHLTKTEAKIAFKTPQKALTPGQSLVIYDGDTVLGGGIISKTA